LEPCANAYAAWVGLKVGAVGVNQGSKLTPRCPAGKRIVAGTLTSCDARWVPGEGHSEEVAFSIAPARGMEMPIVVKLG
jgi:hypothetical protein